MKTKTSRLKTLITLLPFMAIAFCVLSMVTGTRADSVFTPPEIVESISIMREAPASGSPTDYSPIENFAFCNWQIYNATYFEAVSKGDAKADLGFTKYSQNVLNARKVKDKTVFTETVSSSAFVSNAEQTYITPENSVLIRYSQKVHGDSVVWSDKISPMNTDTYFSKYGAVPREVTKYAVSEESVESARLLSFGGGQYVYEFVLKPDIGGRYFRNEIATRAGSSDPAEMQAMKLTLTLDDRWYVLKAETDDTYSVGIPALGKLTVRSVMTETFSYINEDRELPESELFEPYLPKNDDDIIDVPTPTQPQPSDYLAAAFAPYLDGAPLNLDVDLKVMDTEHNIKLGMDIADLNIDALLDNALYVGYGDGNLYLGAGGLNGRLSASSLTDMIDVIGEAVSLPTLDIDLKDQLSDDLLGKLFGGLEMNETEDGVTIDFSLVLSDILKDDSTLKELASKVRGNVSIAVADGEQKTLKYISATLYINDTPIEVYVAPTERYAFPDRSKFENLDGLKDFVKPIINTALAPSYELQIDLGIESETFSDTIKADVTLNRDLTLKAKLDLVKTGITADIVYDGTTVYIACGNVKLKLKTDDLATVLSTVQKALSGFGVNFEIPDIRLPELSVSELLPKLLKLDLSELLSHLKEFTLKDETTLRAAIEIGGSTYGAEISHDKTYLSSLKLDRIEVKGVRLTLGADLTCLDAASPIAAPDGDYADVSELAGFITPIVNTVKAAAYNIKLSLGIESEKFTDTVKADITLNRDLTLSAKLDLVKTGITADIVYDGTTVYIACGNVKLKLKTDDLSEVLTKLQEVLKEFGVNFELPNIKLPELPSELNISELLPKLLKLDLSKLLSHVKEFTIKDANTLRAAISVGESTYGAEISHDCEYLTSLKLDRIEFKGVGLTVGADLICLDEAVPVSAEGEYIDANELLDFVTPLLPLIKQNSFSADLALSALGLDITGDVKLVLSGKNFALKGSINLLGADIDFVYKDGAVYLASGNLKLKLATKDTTKLIASVKGALEAFGVDLTGADLGELNGLVTAVKNISGTLSSVKSMSINELLTDVLKSLTLKDGKLGADVTLGDIAASLSVTGSSLPSVDATLTVGGTDIIAGITLNNDTVSTIDVPDGDYADVAELAGFVTPIVNTVKAAAYNIKLDLGIESEKFTDTVKADITLNRDLTLSAKLDLVKTGITADIVYDGTTVYILCGNVKVKLKTDDLSEVLTKLQEVLKEFGVNFELPNIKLPELPSELNISELLPKLSKLDLSKLLSHVKEFTIKDANTLRAAISVGESTYGAEISHDCEYLTSLKLDRIEFKGVGLTLGADLICLNAAVPVSAEGEYIDANELLDFVTPVLPLIKQNSFSADLTLSALGLDITGDVKLVLSGKNFALKGSLKLLGADIDFVYKDGTVYLASGNLKLKLATKDTTKLIASVKGALEAFGVDLTGADLGELNGLVTAVKNVSGTLSSVKSMSINELLTNVLKSLTLKDGKLGADVTLGDIAASLSVTGSSLPSVDATLTVGGTDITAGITLNNDTVEVIEAPDGNYADARYLIPLLDSVKNAANKNNLSYTLKANLDIKGLKATADVSFDRDLKTIKVTVAVPEYGITATVLYSGKTLYVSALGIDISATAEEARELKDALLPLLDDKTAGTAGMAIDIAAALIDEDISGAIAALPVSDDIKSLLSALTRRDMTALMSFVMGGIGSSDIDISSVLSGLTLELEPSFLSLGYSGFDIKLTHDGSLPKELTVKSEGLDVGVTLDEVLTEKLDVALPEEPITLGELTQFIKPLKDIINNKCFVFDFDASITMDSAVLPVSGQVTLLLKERGMQFELTLKIGDKYVTIASADDVWYIRYDELYISAKASDFDRLIGFVKPYLPAFTPRLIEEIKTTVSDSMPSFGIADIVGMIGGMRMKEDALEVTLGISDVSLTLTVLPIVNDTYSGVSLLATIPDDKLGEISVDLTARLAHTEKTADAVISDDPEVAADEKLLPVLKSGYTFVEAEKLVDYVDSLINTFKQDAYHVSFDNIDVYYADKVHRVSGYVKFQPTSGIPNLRLGFNVYEKKLSESEIADKKKHPIADEELQSCLLHTFDIMITDGESSQEIYLTYNGVRFKLTIEEVRYLLGNLKDALDITDNLNGSTDKDRVSLLDKLIPSDREKVSGAFLDDFALSAITDMADTASGLLTLMTDIINDAQDFMNDPDYDYTTVVGTLQDTVASLTAMLGLGEIKLPSVGSVISSLDKLPDVTMTEGETAKLLRTLTVTVNGAKFTLSRDTERNILSHWTFDDLPTKTTTTDFSLSLLKITPQEVAESVKRPDYYDYDYLDYVNGNVRDELGSPVNDLSHISNITTALLNTANRKNFHIAGNINISILSIIKKDIPLDIYVKLIPTRNAEGKLVNEPLVIINISTPYTLGLLDRSATQIYYWNGNLYFERTLFEKGTWPFTKDKTTVTNFTVSMADFSLQLKDTANLEKYLFYVLPLKGIARSEIEKALAGGSGDGTGSTKFEDIFNYYYFEDKSYTSNGSLHVSGDHNINIALDKLAGSTQLSDAKITLGTDKFALKEGGEEKTYMKSLKLSTKVISIMTLTLNADLDIINEVTEYRTVTSINNDNINYRTNPIMQSGATSLASPDDLKLYADYLTRLTGTPLV